MSASKKHDGFAALRFRDFRLLTIGKFINVMGEQMLGVAIGWELYERTNSAFALGMVGFVQVLPVFLFALVAGHVADQFRPPFHHSNAQIFPPVAAICPSVLSTFAGAVLLVYLCLFIIGAARA